MGNLISRLLFQPPEPASYNDNKNIIWLDSLSHIESKKSKHRHHNSSSSNSNSHIKNNGSGGCAVDELSPVYDDSPISPNSKNNTTPFDACSSSDEEKQQQQTTTANNGNNSNNSNSPSNTTTTTNGNNNNNNNKQVSLVQIPCVFLEYKGSDLCLLYSHGNATDLGQMMPYLELLRSTLKVCCCCCCCIYVYMCICRDIMFSHDGRRKATEKNLSTKKD